MSDHLNKGFTDKLDEGYVAGESLQSFRNSLKGEGGLLAQSLVGQETMKPQHMGNSENDIFTWIAPYDLQITAIYGTKTTSGDTIVAVMTAAGNNPLSAANINLHTVVADTPASQTLSATPANLLMSAGDLFKCTFTTGAAGTLTGGAVCVQFKPTK